MSFLTMSRCFTSNWRTVAGLRCLLAATIVAHGLEIRLVSIGTEEFCVVFINKLGGLFQ
jgi:hypothetical protein